MASTKLCDSCEELIKTLRSSPSCDSYTSDEPYVRYKWKKEINPHDTAARCDVCKLLSRVDRSQEFIGTEELPREIITWFSSSHPLGQRGCIAQITFDNPSLRSRVHLSTWVDNGPGLDISTEPPIFTNDPYEAIPLITKWISECQKSHRKCSPKVCEQTISEECVTLPTRVLSVANRQEIKLLESRDLKGRYCALSYCWGPDGAPHLKTVKENLEVHRKQGIPFSRLPKTFQDASIITHELGVEYLWIDALCVLQDDMDDWSSEGKALGSIYENAFLVIVAAGSSNPNGGCFIGKRPEDPPAVAIPVKTGTKHVTNLNFRLMPSKYIHPSSGPLGRRGWAFQERYLSRRKVFFMPGGISWACRGISMGERSELTDLGHMPWPYLLEEYTSLNLSFITDRLPAIQTTAMTVAGTGQYFWGVWDTSLLVQCLWISFIDAPLTGTLSGVPSWSWARTGGAKIWPTPDSKNAIWEVRVKFHETDQSGRILSVSGRLREVDRSTRVNDCCVMKFSNGFKYDGPTRSEEYWLTHDFEDLLRIPYEFYDSSDKFLGFGVFDAKTASPYVFGAYS
ncbi:heterokaryon incompatibility protein-domain-containing protein [Nemania diffusa]|nr:heterokaryon incompatibility protein-domain-containing protein [Nemania diffusa]